MRNTEHWGRYSLPALSHRKGPIVEMTEKKPLPQRVRKTPVTSGVHLAEDVLARYRVVAERLLEHLEGPEREALKDEARLTHLQVTGAIREIGEETYGGASS